MPERITTMREHLRGIACDLMEQVDRHPNKWRCIELDCDAVFAGQVEFVDQLEKHSEECSFRVVAVAALAHFKLWGSP